MAVDEHRGDGPGVGEHSCHLGGHPRIGHTDELTPDTTGVGDRPEEVEHAGNAQLAANRRSVAHRRMEPWGETEPDADVFDAARHCRRGEFEHHTQSFEHIGRARLRTGGAPAVLAHDATGTRHDEHRRGRDVDGVAPVAAGAARADGLLPRRVRQRHRDRHGQHCRQGSPEFVDGFAFGPQADEQSAHLGGRGRSLEDLADGGADDFGGEVVAGAQPGEHLGPAPERGQRAERFGRDGWCRHAVIKLQPSPCEASGRTDGPPARPVRPGRVVAQAARRRWRMMRRRSRSVQPPQIPSRSRAIRAYSRHWRRTGQSAQMAFASSASSSDTG